MKSLKDCINESLIMEAILYKSYNDIEKDLQKVKKFIFDGKAANAAKPDSQLGLALELTCLMLEDILANMKEEPNEDTEDWADYIRYTLDGDELGDKIQDRCGSYDRKYEELEDFDDAYSLSSIFEMVWKKATGKKL